MALAIPATGNCIIFTPALHNYLFGHPMPGLTSNNLAHSFTSIRLENRLYINYLIGYNSVYFWVFLFGFTVQAGPYTSTWSQHIVFKFAISYNGYYY